MSDFREDNPYAAPPSYGSDSGPTSRYPGSPRQDRSGALLGLGVSSLLFAVMAIPFTFCCCGINVPIHLISLTLGVIAVAMGHSDLRAIDAGAMNPASGPNTRYGYYMGWAGTVISVLGLLGFVAFLIFGIMSNNSLEF